MRVLARVSLLPIRHRQILRAERRVRLKAAHAAVRPVDVTQRLRERYRIQSFIMAH